MIAAFINLMWDIHFVSWTVESPSERLRNLPPKRHRLCMHIPPPKRPDIMIDSEITSNRCNHIWLCNRSLDGDTLQLQNGGHPSDIAQ